MLPTCSPHAPHMDLPYTCSQVASLAPDGDMYDGTWKAGLKDGPGTYYYASGNADVVNYSAGEEVDEGVRFLADRSAGEEEALGYR